MWMSDQSQMSNPMISEDTGNATSLQESLFGATPSDSLAGPMTKKSGREAVHARASRQQAKARGLMMLVTSVRHGGPSSASVALQSCLESRLHQRFDTAGGTLYPLIWKVRHTPLRRRYLHRQALAARTSGTGFTGWPIPTNDDPNNVSRKSGQFKSLVRDVNLCGWPTPNVMQGGQTSRSGDRKEELLMGGLAKL
jgi:hypothetical protein